MYYANLKWDLEWGAATLFLTDDRTRISQMKHNSDFKHDLEWGQMGENVVADIVAGDKTEVKSERNIWKRTRNHYVEFQSRGKPSGIATTEAK